MALKTGTIVSLLVGWQSDQGEGQQVQIRPRLLRRAAVRFQSPALLPQCEAVAG